MIFAKSKKPNKLKWQVKAGRGEKVNPASKTKDAANKPGGASSGVSEAIFPELLNEQVSKYEEFMSSADALVPDKILERPQRRLRAMEELREEIVTASEEVNQKINDIFSKLKANAYQ